MLNKNDGINLINPERRERISFLYVSVFALIIPAILCILCALCITIRFNIDLLLYAVLTLFLCFSLVNISLYQLMDLTRLRLSKLRIKQL